MCGQRLGVADPPRPRVIGRKVRERPPYIHSDMYCHTLSDAFSSCFSNGIEICYRHRHMWVNNQCGIKANYHFEMLDYPRGDAGPV